MPTLRAARAAFASAVLAASALAASVLAVAPLGAQVAWNDARTMDLVRSATRLRSLQLADTGLRDYTARATGTVTFLAQFGDGAFSRPIVVKADQLELEVYWGAPDRSKQSIVGRRDTLLFPNDMQYHRDHLGIIQNNFPDIIRLGDGDEVMDVVHPLSPRGPETYDYALADSLAIRGSGVNVDVMMISVRPKDPLRPAAVGAVYLDRASGNVVRMTFSFTRAALRDRQLEDVSIILENGLVNGRFWLPRRQEIEIRRSASWMDFPAKGIIRGRWEVCCVETNRSLASPVFAGQEIVEAGTREQLRRHPSFKGDVLSSLPEDVRALDADEVRAVQEEARRLVQESALRRVRSGNLAARRISDFVRSDRVEGLALGAGLSQKLGAGFSSAVIGRYGTADSRWKGRGTLGWQRVSGLSVTAAGFDDWQQLGEVTELSGLRNSLASQEFGSDWTQPIGVVGGSLRLQFAPPDAPRFWMEATLQDERGLVPRARSAYGRFEPTLPAQALERRALALGVDVGSGNGERRVSARLVGSEWQPRDGSARGRNLRGALDAEFLAPLGPLRLRSRTVLAALSGGLQPVQDAVLLGGPHSAPGYDFHTLLGQQGFSQRLEIQRRIPFVPINLGRFGRVPGTLVLAPFAHAAWVGGRGASGPAGDPGWYPAVGLGAIGFFDIVRVDVARGLREGRWTFSVDVSPALWPVL
jgi:hypothetical protein